MIRTKVIDLRK